MIEAAKFYVARNSQSNQSQFPKWCLNCSRLKKGGAHHAIHAGFTLAFNNPVDYVRYSLESLADSAGAVYLI